MKNATRGALVIAAGGLVAKIIGAIYRVPLTNLIGAEAIGLYQTVFPLYTILLALSSTGIPAALSTLGEDEREGGKIAAAFYIFGALGFVGSAAMFFLSRPVATLQGNPSAAPCYRALSPSVFVVSLIACARGRFQGTGNMTPTAISQIIEQVVKAASGLSACLFLEGNSVAKAVYACLAVTLSEVVAALFLLLKLPKKRPPKFIARSIIPLLALTLPVSLGALILPLGHLADSFIIMNVLRRPDAPALFGLYSGSVAAVISLPVTASYGAAAVMASGGHSDEKFADSVRFTGFIAIPSAIFLLLFSSPVIDFLYGGMGESERLIASAILKVQSFSVISLSFHQTVSAALLARKKQKITLLSSVLSLAVRIPATLFLVSRPALGIIGAAAASALSELVALGFSLAFVKVKSREFAFLFGALFASIMCVSGGFLLFSLIGGKLGLVLSAVLAAALYLLVFSVSRKASARIFPRRAENASR